VSFFYNKMHITSPMKKLTRVCMNKQNIKVLTYSCEFFHWGGDVHFIIVIQLLIFGPLGIAFCVLDIFLLLFSGCTFLYF
jgi:hypothetical protein